MALVDLLPPEGRGSNANDLVSWVQQRPHEELASSAQELFEKLLANASQPRSSTADACVKLCGFVRQSARSKEEPLRLWAFSEDIADHLLNFYLEWNEKDAHRSMRLVLDLLSTLIPQNPSTRVREAVKEDILSTLVSVIARVSMRPLVKSCLSCLNHLLLKAIFTLDDVLRKYRELRPDLAEEPDIILWQEWVAEVFRWMKLHYACPVAGKLLVLIFSGLYSPAGRPATTTGSAEFDVGVMRTWVETALAINPDILESIKNYVLAPLFKFDRALSIAFLEELNKKRPEEDTSGDELDTAALLHLAALEIGKKASVVDEPNPAGAEQPDNVVVLSREILERFLIHNSHDVRSSAISLLTTSASTTKPYSDMAFDLLRKHLKSCHADSDAKFRNEILSHSKNMVKRIKGATTLLQRDISRPATKAPQPRANEETPVNTHISKGARGISNAGEPWLRETLKAHEEFYSWYLQFLRQELVPTASYQRHITALRALVSVVRLGKETPSPAEQQIYQDPQWTRIIMDLIMDPFDDAREAATSLLMMCPAETVQAEVIVAETLPPSTPLRLLEEFCSRAAAQASRTARADHADGAARSHGLLCAWQSTLEKRVSLLSQTLDVLESKIGRAEEDLGQAVMVEPVHGDFAAVRYIWEFLSLSSYSEDELEALSAPQSRILSLCSRIWDAVSYVLCDDSPEGHLPEELEEIEGLDTKGLLSYSFRAIHESSNLMRTIVGNLKLGRGAGCLLPTPEVFSRAGNLAFTQLSTLRHRGAFSSVSLNFTCCCQHARDPRVATSAEQKSLLETWYKGALSCIDEQRSTTRRSAGIPALITGLLASNASSPSFEEVMRTLQEIARKPAPVTETDGSNLPQVHAFNCLKEVFKNSLLSKKAEFYLPECLQLATNSLRAEVWAIRNCALLLLRSLMDSLFGTNETKSSMESGWDGRTLRISYTKYSSLPPILLHLLQSSQQAMEPGTLTQSSAAESVFPALDIIRRAGPPESHRDELYTLIATYLGSRQWHVREIAARTLGSFLLNEEWLSSIQALLKGSRGSANRLHGTLLTIKSFLERMYAKELRDLGATLRDFEQDATMCSETWAAYTEVQNLLWELDPSALPVLVGDSRTSSSHHPTGPRLASRALLDSRLATRAMQEATTARDLGALRACLRDALAADTDTACALIEAVPATWGDERAHELCLLYLEVCRLSGVPEARAAALTNLAALMDDHITRGKIGDLPGPEDTDPFLQLLFLPHDSGGGGGVINPALANAMILASGPVVAAQALAHAGRPSFFLFEQKLRSWGAAMARALHDGNALDMRMAAARSLGSLAAALRGAAGADAAYLPFLLSLYRTLADDDDGVRDAGALAVAYVMTPAAGDGDGDGADNPHPHPHPHPHRPQPLVAVDAADALLAWAQARFGRTNEFRAYTACRLAGDPLVAVDIGVQDLSAWAPPREQFAAALAVDESLFAVEEQNLFADEVREAGRWAGVFRATGWWDHYEEEGDEGEGETEEVGPGAGGDGSVVVTGTGTGTGTGTTRTLVVDGPLAALKGWVEEALRVLVGLVGEDDGPLGWASRADAFALCHRVIVCGRVLAEVLGGEGQGAAIAGLLSRVGEVGRASRLHGLLLSALE